MPAVQVRDLPQESYQQLKADAKRNGRSINQHLKVIVGEYLNGRSEAPVPAAPPAAAATQTQQRIAQRKALLNRIHSQEPFDFPQGLEPETLVRQARDAR